MTYFIDDSNVNAPAVPFYTPWISNENPTVPGLYLTKTREAGRRLLVKLVYWTGTGWRLSGNFNKAAPYTQGDVGHLVQRRTWCGLAVNPHNGQIATAVPVSSYTQA